MSYRLIDANAIAESYPEANDTPCIYADLPRGLDGGHYDMREPSELQRENAKLRELVSKLYGGYMGGHYMISCNGCEHAYEDYGGYEPLDPDYCVFSFSDRYVGCWRRKRLEEEMRELGVEVN